MRYVLYCRGKLVTDDYTRILVPIFTDIERAARFVHEFIGNDDFGRDGNTIKLMVSHRMEISCEQLPEILKSPEAEDLSSIDERRIMRFKYGSWDGMSVKPRLGGDVATDNRPARIERERRPERPTGFVTIGDLAASWGVLPMHARAALRASGREKPAYGWAFDPAEVKAIKELIGIA